MPPNIRRRILACTCNGTIPLDTDALRITGDEVRIHARLCRDEVELAVRAMDMEESDGGLMICCTHAAPLFAELAAERGVEPPLFADIRESAGWSVEADRAGPKMAALVAAAWHATEPAPVMELTLSGRCLIVGDAEPALALAEMLKDALSVSVLLTGGEDDVLPPPAEEFVIRKGRLARLDGGIGHFRAELEDVRTLLPWARGGLMFSGDVHASVETFDVVAEISDGPARFAPHGREGYFHVMPSDGAALADAARRLAEMVGEFEKPLHVLLDRGLCAHSRNGIEGCRRCLDACPTSAIVSDGETVRIDPHICDGCGDCSAVCPSGAPAFTMPRRADLLERGRILLDTYRQAGGERPVLLLHDERHGAPLIAALARFADGLPANVIPVAMHSVHALAHEVMAALMVAGAARLAVLAPARSATEGRALDGQVELLGILFEALGYPPHAVPVVLRTDDPFELETLLTGLEIGDPLATSPISALGGRRDVARMALEKLHAMAPDPVEVVPLPMGAPYGRVVVDAQKCTLCLACVSTCPAGALGDDPQRPRLRFAEAACVQCGLCRRACPEGAMTLEPRWSFAPSAREWVVLCEDEPMTCPACGKDFGSRRAIERVIATLAGRNPMFVTEEQQALLRYCEDCRVIALSRQGGDPFAMGEAPRPRTTEDYLDDGKNES